MYSSPSMSSIIEDYKSKASSKSRTDYRKRIKRLAASLTNWSYATRGSSFVLNEIFYCYVYLDPRYPGDYSYLLPSGRLMTFKFLPFYVGKGKNRRASAHLIEARSDKSKSLKANTIRKIWKLGKEPILKCMKSRVDEATSLAFEIDLIAGIGRTDQKNGSLTNLSNGGEGASGATHSEEARIRHSEATSKAKLGSVQTTEHVEKRVKNIRGKKQTREHVGKRAAAITGIKRTAEQNKANSERSKGRLAPKHERDAMSKYKIVVNGTTITAKEISRDYNVPYGIVLKRFKAEVTDLQELTAPEIKKGPKTLYIKYEGTSRSVKQWSEITGLSTSAIRCRFYRGLPTKEIFRT